MVYKLYKNAERKRKIIFEESNAICDALKFIDKYKEIEINGQLFELFKFELIRDNRNIVRYVDRYILKFGLAYKFYQNDVSGPKESILILQFLQSELKNKSMIEVFIQDSLYYERIELFKTPYGAGEMKTNPKLIPLCESFILNYVKLLSEYNSNPCLNCLHAPQYKLSNNCKEVFKNTTIFKISYGTDQENIGKKNENDADSSL